jgi:carbonic anhydrase
MEFGVYKIGVKLVVVLGHTKCGAIAGACSNVKLGNLTGLLEKINPAIDSEVTIETDRDGSNPVFVDKVAELNVHKTMDRIRNESSLIAEYEKEGKIKIVGGMYSVETGGVTFFS